MPFRQTGIALKAGHHTVAFDDSVLEFKSATPGEGFSYFNYKSGSIGTTYRYLYTNSVTIYAWFERTEATVTFVAPSTATINRGSYTVSNGGTTTTISTSDQTITVDGSTTLTATMNGAYAFKDWYSISSGVKTILSTENPYTGMLTDGASVGMDYKEITANHTLLFKAVDKDADGNRKGSYTVDAVTVSATDYEYFTGAAYTYSPTMTATPATGYSFKGWYVKDGKTKNYISYANPWTPTFSEDTVIYADFVFTDYADDVKAQFKVGSYYTYDLNDAVAHTTSSNKTIVCVRDGLLIPGTYTIPSGITLYIPYNTSETSLTKPAVVTSAATLSAYRTLIFVDGADIICNGTICVGGQMMSGAGNKASGYPTGACGVINMANGGHIELNNGATLYAWGYIQGQDIDQGNNTLNVGTITANSGATVWEDISFGDYRGGGVCAVLTQTSGHRSFPFQSYSIQNIEVPLTIKYGALEQVYTNVYANSSTNETSTTLIGTGTALFLLKNEASVVRKWYDATTDLVCYELSGTAQLYQLSVSIGGIVTVNSKDYDLPITSGMHIIMTDCDMTISYPIYLQPGAVVEIKPSATVTLASNLYVVDNDEWRNFILTLYFKSFSNLTKHKNRGDGKSKDLLDDAKLIVDGTLNVTGGLYTSTGGGDIMGNHGGKITFPSSLPSAKNLYLLKKSAAGDSGDYDEQKHYGGVFGFGAGDVYFTYVPTNSANLHNENDTYTKTEGSKTYHNVHGRWFVAADKDPKDNHTHSFTYISSGAVSGTGGTTTPVPAVYSWDKTGLELRQKWENVTADACANWWVGNTDSHLYNWTLNSEWHQFLPTEEEGYYSGSNNTIYAKSGCSWESIGETDENCLYTIFGVKKALVDGHFISLSPNDDDPAFHETANPTNYYICFEGCNWHAATKVADASKAYTVEGNDYIWFENHWFQATHEAPFYYTYDETNVKVYYEYLDEEWVVAEPYVSVKDIYDSRFYVRLSDAFSYASGRAQPTTITILRDINGITTAVSYTGANKTCTLNLNGHTINGTVNNMITVNAAGCTFYVVDNTTEKKGKINYVFAANNSRRRAFYVQNGHVILNSGTIATTNTLAYSSTYTKPIAEGVLVANGKQFTMNGGRIEVSSAHNPYGVEGASGTPTININGGTIEAVAETRTSPYAIYSYGTINITGGTINAIAKANTSAIGVYVVGNGATANISGGTILARSTGSSQGVYCWGSATVTGDYNAETPDNTPKSRSYSIVNITGGTITAECTTSTKAYGVISYGTTNISGGTITATVQKSSQNTAYGVCTYGGVTTISDGANITANAPTKAYGVTATATNGSTNYGWAHLGELHVEGGTITANTTGTTTAYGLLVTGATWTINKTDGYSVFNGDYAGAGTAIVTGGTFNVNAKTTLSRGIAVAATKVLNAASATPQCTINGGYFKMAGTGDVLGCNDAAAAADFQINGGYYSHDGNLASYTPSPKQVLTLASGDANRPPYYYKVAEAYLVTFKTEDGSANIIDPVYQEVGTQPVCSTEPTKASTTTNSFTFDGWATEANGTKVYEPNGLPNVTSAGATYYAHFATTTLKYRVHFDAATNGGECATENIYVNPGSAISTEIATLPTATKYGYTFNGWYTAASSGTKITTATVPTGDVIYYAQFTANSHTLTWDLAGGKVSTAGKIGSTTWPAKNATGTQSRSVAYGTVLTTIPVLTKTGYVFNRWDPVPGSSMPDNDVTYTALWNPATNTAYTVKHYQQNADGTYPTDPTETQSLTGTTDASVTPNTKTYTGFTSPEKQTVTIAADGSTVVEYQYPRLVYTIRWNANGGSCSTYYTNVRYGEALGASMPTATLSGFVQTGWFTAPVGGTQVTAATPIVQNYDMLYAQYAVSTETGFWLDIIDVDNTNHKLIVNANNSVDWPAASWPFSINDVMYYSGTTADSPARDAKNRLEINYGSLEPGVEFSITVKNIGNEIVSKHTYIIPQEVTSATELSADAARPIFVKGTTLTIKGSITTKNIYVGTDAKLVIDEGKTLTADTIFLRTTPEGAAELINQGTISASTQLCYTRIIMVKGQYYQFGLPLPCAISSVKLSDNATLKYQTGWLLRAYSESKRAAQGTEGKNWETLKAAATIEGGKGYEMYSGSNYYREFYFPVDHAALATNKELTVTRTEGEAGEKHAGWNVLVSPLTYTCNNDAEPEDMAICLMTSSGWEDQTVLEHIAPAQPFAYQAAEAGTISFVSATMPSLAPRHRIAAANEPTRIQWIRLDVKDANGEGDETSIYSHPTRYEEYYQTGIDVAKQSLTATRARLYSSHTYGDMAFAGVSDELFEQGVALTLYSPAAQELTFSLRRNDWLNRLEYVWIVDTETGAMIDLLSSDYTAQVTEGTTYGRFYISGRFHKPGIATDIEPTSDSSLKGRAQKVLIEEKIYILVGDKLYDATGKLVKGK